MKSTWQDRAAARAARQTKPRVAVAMASTARPAQATYTPAASVDVSAAIAEALRRDRARIRSILDAPEAVGREESAKSLAYGTDTDAAVARRMLAGLQLDADAETDEAVRQILKHSRPRRSASVS